MFKKRVKKVKQPKTPKTLLNKSIKEKIMPKKKIDRLKQLREQLK
jgi:hypothetical protein